MNEPTWGYSNPVGEWIVSLEIPGDVRARATAPLWYVLHLVVPLVAPWHRLRKAVVSWGEYDAGGQEQSFHELEELEDVDWSSLENRLKHLLSGDHRAAVSALFLELDTRVVSGGGEHQQETWAEGSAELQISFVAPELCPPLASVTYSTAIDVWLPVTYDTHFATRSNEAMSAANLPRLEEVLKRLSSLSQGKIQLGQSKLYSAVLTTSGFARGAKPT